MAGTSLFWKLLLGAAVLLWIASLTMESLVASHIRSEFAPHVDAELVDAGVDRIVGRARLAALILSGAGIALVGFTAQRTRRALARVRSVMDELPTAEGVARLPASREDELGRLEDSANELATRINDWYRTSREAHGMRETIFAAMNEGLLAVDSSQRIMIANPAARAMLGLEGDILERALWELVRTPEITRAVTDCLQKGERTHTEVHIEADLEQRVFDLQVTPLREQVGGCFLVLHEITELRRLEEVRRQFVANVSHELKTPLTSMRGYVEAVLDDPDLEPERQRKFLDKANRNTERLERIVGDLLSLARLESDKATLNLEVVDIAGLIEGVLDEFREIAERRRIELRFEGTNVRAKVEADPLVLDAAVTNLVSNALRYSPDAATVRVALSMEGAEVLIEVIDNGPGIAPLEQERIFERFYRVDKNRSRELGGTGLGLSIVRRAVSAHGGVVSVESALGRGSTFQVRLPGISEHDIDPADRPFTES